MDSTTINMIALPAGLGIFVTMVVGTLKAAGLKDDIGGKVSLFLTGILVLGLTFAVEGFGLDVEGEQPAAVFAILGYLGQAGLAFLAAFVSHKVSRAAKIASPKTE